MDKTFDPAAVERRVSDAWQRAGAFRAGRPDRVNAPPFSVVIPPPNVTGSLHMGHALNNTLQDILCRFERMRGKDVLWQPGTDHAGIATQMVVERQLMERQEPNRRDLGREEFVKRVWVWKAESGGTIVNQLKRLGASCDWSRERFTMDEGLSRAVAKVFVQLYREGLIYKDKRLVNYDPKLQTAISDLEVQQVEVKGYLWHLKYAVVDDAGKETGDFITVATTRPETMLGDTGVAVHPNDDRYRDLHGRRVRLPLVGRLIPIVTDSYSDPEKGTGAVKITPAHDFNDFEVGRRHDLPLVNVLDADAKITLRDNESFLAGVPQAAEVDEMITTLEGQDRFDARKLVVEMMEARGLLAATEPHTHVVPHGERSGAVVEPWLTDQWYVDAKTLAQPALAAVRDGRANFIPKNWEKTYFDWLDHIEPWCISRQLWWGHQIPAWYAPWGAVYVAETEEEAIAEALGDAVTREIYDDDEAARIAEDPRRSGELLTRDEDVLDTWFSSALWPFSTLGWPGETPELKRYYPTSVLVTGFDIIFFWVARMMMMGLHFRGEVPFRDVYIHALVRDEKGAKMSKSKGNVIDPLHLIDEYGADALRFTLAALAAQGRDVKLSTQRVEGYRNFATKLWNAFRFAEMNQCVHLDAYEFRLNSVEINRWILSQAASAAAEVTGSIEAYRFNDAAQAVYRFIWNVVCDWYLELVKPLLSGGSEEEQQETRETIGFVLEICLKLLHPFMPFLTEELWHQTRAAPASDNVLALAPWPDLAGYESAEDEAQIGWMIDLISEIRSIRAELNVPAAAQIPLVLVEAAPDVATRAAKWNETIRRLARLADITTAPAVPAGAVQAIVDQTVIALPLGEFIDIAAERARLAKEIAREEKDVAKTDAKLANADFLERAPEEVVEENRQRRVNALARIAKMLAALERLAAV
ncbi:MAG: valyl-tRNA synthetase [Methylobacteriaceae bacterium]|nr:valyl-tRNA synthetase [Methylobacteriaceae bacterium]